MNLSRTCFLYSTSLLEEAPGCLQTDACQISFIFHESIGATPRGPNSRALRSLFVKPHIVLVALFAHRAFHEAIWEIQEREGHKREYTEERVSLWEERQEHFDTLMTIYMYIPMRMRHSTRFTEEIPSFDALEGDRERERRK